MDEHTVLPGRARPATTADPLVPHDLTGWFDRATAIVRRSLRPLTLIMAISALASTICDVAINHALAAMPDAAAAGGPAGPGGTDLAGQVSAGPLPYLVIGVALALLGLTTAFLQAMAVHVVVRDAAGRPAPLGEAARFATGLAVPLLAWWLVAGLLVFAGSLFLLVPGIYLGVVLFSSLTMVVLVERRGLGRCFTLVKGRFLATAGRVSLLLLISAVGYLPAALVEWKVAGTATDLLTADAASLLTAGLAIPLGVVLTAFLVVTYTELRRYADPTVSTARVAEEMSR